MKQRFQTLALASCLVALLSVSDSAFSNAGFGRTDLAEPPAPGDQPVKAPESKESSLSNGVLEGMVLEHEELVQRKQAEIQALQIAQDQSLPDADLVSKYDESLLAKLLYDLKAAEAEFEASRARVSYLRQEVERLSLAITGRKRQLALEEARASYRNSVEYLERIRAKLEKAKLKP